MAKNLPTSMPSPSSPTWQNWSGNIVHKPATDGLGYYFFPTTLAELKSVLAQAAKTPGATLRVSGQRHSQPPLVIDDNRSAVPQTTHAYLVDMSCYADLGPAQDQRIMLGPGKDQVIVNTGVCEDELDAFLTQNKFMLKTVTAGGFFSLGGMTAVDVHGATMGEPIFAETVSSFNILLADGTVMTINEQSPKVDDWSPLQFARVSLGGLGIVTSLTIEVQPRPHATTLQGGCEWYGIKDKEAFITHFPKVLSSHDRLETFFTPYATADVDTLLHTKNFLALWWNVVSNPSPKSRNQASNPYPKSACEHANQTPPQYGAPDLGEFLEHPAEVLAIGAQKAPSPGNTILGAWEDGAFFNPAVIAALALKVIEKQAGAANAKHSELWLADAARVIFMSYYVPIPDLEAAGLAIVWDGLDVVSKIVLQDDNFHIAAPMEFRFVRGGDSAMSGTYSDKPDQWFVNLDLIGFADASLQASDYPPLLLKFFADVERAWVEMGGIPHNGKIYGFYDPTDLPGTYSTNGPFNPNFLAALRVRRGGRLKAFSDYRKQLDPNGLFYNDFLRKLLED